MADDFGFFSSSESGAPEAAEEDPAAAFLAQQESEIAGIENDEGFGAPAGSQGGLAQPGPASGGESARWPGYWGLAGGIWGSHPGSSASGPCVRAKKACYGQPEAGLGLYVYLRGTWRRKWEGDLVVFPI